VSCILLAQCCQCLWIVHSFLSNVYLRMIIIYTGKFKNIYLYNWKKYISCLNSIFIVDTWLYIIIILFIAYQNKEYTFN
jgi:hypothetical protein